MKKMKTFFALVLAVTMLLSAVSCGKGGTDTTTQSTVADTVNNTVNTTQNAVEQTNVVDVTHQSTTSAPVTATQSEVTTEAQTQAGITDTPTQAATQGSTQPLTENQQPQSSVEYTEIESPEYSKQIVYYPSAMKNSNKKYPGIVWANGTACTPDMYKGLLAKLAEGGYIVVANYESMAADGTAQIGSVNFILEENSNSASIFNNKVNTSKIGLAGHSQGGRSSVNAAAKDSRIICVLSLAGSNFDYEAELLGTPTFFIAGGSDMIVSASKWIVPAYDVCKGPAVYASLNGAIHTTCCTSPESYSNYAVKWFDAYLKNDSNAKNIFKEGGALSQDGAWSDFRCKGI